MRQGTTPTHTFTLPVPAADVVDSRITYFGDADWVILEKKMEDCDVVGNVLHLTLTQDETFSFPADKRAFVQVRALDKNGKAFTSGVDSFYVARAVNKEVLDG